MIESYKNDGIKNVVKNTKISNFEKNRIKRKHFISSKSVDKRGLMPKRGISNFC